jgi:hypothetical protein
MGGYYGDDGLGEQEEIIQNAEKYEKALAAKQARDFMRWRDQIVQDEIRQASEELGLSQADHFQHMKSPGYERDLRKATRKLVERGAKRVKGAAPTERRPAQRGETAPRRGRVSESDFAEIKSRAQRGQLSDDELCDLMPRLIP